MAVIFLGVGWSNCVGLKTKYSVLFIFFHILLMLYVTSQTANGSHSPDIKSFLTVTPNVFSVLP